MKTKNEYLTEQGIDLEKDFDIGTYSKIRFAMENFANDYHKSEVLKLSKANVIKSVCDVCGSDDTYTDENNIQRCTKCKAIA